MAGVVKRNLAAKYNRIEQQIYENYLNAESQAAFTALLLIPLLSDHTTANREIQELSPLIAVGKSRSQSPSTLLGLDANN